MYDVRMVLRLNDWLRIVAMVRPGSVNSKPVNDTWSQSMDKDAKLPNLLAQTARIVEAQVKQNKVAAVDLAKLIADVYRSLSDVVLFLVRARRPRSRGPIKASITPSYLICLEDGAKLKTLKRHLRVAHNMSPEVYRERWKLPGDYLMVAPDYAERRSEIAKELGLGTRRIRRKRSTK